MMVDLFGGGAAGWEIAARALGIESVGIEWDGLACEQVPEVLGYWRWIARELRELGYSTWAGILNAADYGTPQVRKRAILLASLDRQVAPPEPTHSETGHAEMFGAGRKRWVSMAEALGWGLTDRPAYVVAGGDHGGGHHDGGSGQRRQIAKHKAEGRWLPKGEPCFAAGCSSAGECRGFCTDADAEASIAGQDGTATIARAGARRRTGTLTERATGHEPYERDVDRPAPTVRTNSGGRWTLSTPGRSYDAPCGPADPLTEPAPTVALVHNSAAWCWQRPATTVMGDARVFPPGGHHPENGDAKSWSSQSIPVEMWELGVLQGFPADHPWRPPYVAAQIGNAVPVPLALACLDSVIGKVA